MKHEGKTLSLQYLEKEPGVDDTGQGALRRGCLGAIPPTPSLTPPYPSGRQPPLSLSLPAGVLLGPSAQGGTQKRVVVVALRQTIAHSVAVFNPHQQGVSGE